MALDDIKVHVKFKLAALWTSVMFCYVYGDFFGLYQPRVMQAILHGNMPPLGPVTQGVLLGTSISVAIPGVMVFLSLALPAVANRWTNVVLGAVYTLIMLITMPGAWAFYIFFGIVEIVLTILVVWYAWTWPKLLSS